MNDNLETERLDILIFNKGLASSRERAKQLVLNKSVKVNGKTIEKPGQKIEKNSVIEIVSQEEYASRGAFKLKKAIEIFKIDLVNKISIDIGASTGGFTDLMLKHGAKKVYAIDVGCNQLADVLKCDKRVVQMDKTNFRYIDTEIFTDKIDFVSIDVSFISLKYILTNVSKIIDSESDVVALIKPQFEAGRKNIGKNGIVKDKKIHLEVLMKINQYCIDNNLLLKDIIYSPITGGDGNIEYLTYIKKMDEDMVLSDDNHLDYKKIVEEAFNNLKINKNYKI